MLLEENKPSRPSQPSESAAGRWFAEAASEDDVAEAAAWARERALLLFVLAAQ